MTVYATTLPQPHPELLMKGVQRWLTLADPLLDGVLRLAIHAGDAIVGTVDVVRCLPILAGVDLMRRPWGVCIGRIGDGTGSQLATYQSDQEFPERFIDDQLPFCDWSPGRWAVEVANPVRTTALED